MSRLPIRVRLTLAFAFTMAVVLAAMGFFVYQRVAGSLLASVDQTLRSQAAEAASHVRRGADLGDRDVEGGTTLAQVIDRQGQVIRSDPAGLVRLLSAADVRRVSAGARVHRSTTLLAPRGDWRVLAVPARLPRRRGRRRTLARAA